jgi:hypothetical protein
MFLIAFTCSVASMTSASAFQCSDRTNVQLAAIRPITSVVAPSNTLIAQRLKCQGFDSKGAGHLIATCRLPTGEDLGCALVNKGLANEVVQKQRQYELPTCRERAAPRKTK